MPEQIGRAVLIKVEDGFYIYMLILKKGFIAFNLINYLKDLVIKLLFVL